ncbi:MAG: ATP synthase subunit I [Candidatus Cloacimonadota bacterium]|nr:ATP synthase subunit I [Candidatus Cloacimonadota bacterium]
MIKQFYQALSPKNQHFFIGVSFLILLTATPSIFLLQSDFKFGIGWLFGSFGSLINFIWMVIATASAIYQGEAKAKVGAIKGFYFRFMFLLVYSVLVVIFLKPNIIGFGVGLISAQICIIIYEIINYLKNSKLKKYFFEDKDEKKE